MKMIKTFKALGTLVILLIIKLLLLPVVIIVKILKFSKIVLTIVENVLIFLMDEIEREVTK